MSTVQPSEASSRRASLLRSAAMLAGVAALVSIAVSLWFQSPRTSLSIGPALIRSVKEQLRAQVLEVQVQSAATEKYYVEHADHHFGPFKAGAYRATYDWWAFARFSFDLERAEFIPLSPGADADLEVRLPAMRVEVTVPARQFVRTNDRQGWSLDDVARARIESVAIRRLEAHLAACIARQEQLLDRAHGSLRTKFETLARQVGANEGLRLRFVFADDPPEVAPLPPELGDGTLVSRPSCEAILQDMS